MKSVFPIDVEVRNKINYTLFNNKIAEAIRERKAFTASDTSMKNNQIEEYWIVTDINQEEKIQNTLYYKEWKSNIIKGAEVIIILELLIVLERRGRNIENGKIVIGLDNRKVYQKLIDKIRKACYHTQDARVEIAQMKRLIKKIKFKLEFKLVKGHRSLISSF